MIAVEQLAVEQHSHFIVATTCLNEPGSANCSRAIRSHFVEDLRVWRKALEGLG